MALSDFLTELQTLLDRSEELKAQRPKGKPEENTKGSLLTPFIEALGYGPGERTFEGTIKTLTSEWVDYFLLPDKRRAPWMMLEAKSFWDKNLWDANRDQVLRYMRDYSLMVAGDAPINWLILTNFNEWHVLRLNDREPFWTFSADDLRDTEFARHVYECFARENIPRERLLSRFTEGQRDELGERFLSDLKTWRMVLANGLRQHHSELSLEELRGASHTILLRFLFIRLLENYGRERYYSLGTLFDMWSKAFQSLPFSQSLQAKFRDTWASYNTELFSESWVDTLCVPNEYLELLILPDAVPDPTLVSLPGTQMFGYRSVYNYDFSTLTQDILGVAYEQFLAHELVISAGTVQVLDNQETRKREGVFYTPEYIVQHIVRRVLEPQVKPHLDQALDKLAVDDYPAAYDAARRILNVRVVDPACGSGSFLLGAYTYLSEALERYNRAAQERYQKSWDNNGSGNLFSGGAPAAPPKQIAYPHERVLVGCIYGVDLDPQAVGLAKLSLWTQLLRAHPGQYGKKGAPHAQLPALTLNIRSGNSLIDAQSAAPRGLGEQDLSEHRDALQNAADFARRAKDVDAAAQDRREVLTSLENAIQEVNAALLPNLLPFFASDETLYEAITADKELELTTDAVRHYLITGTKPNILKEVEDKTLTDILARLRAHEKALEDARRKRPFNWSVEFPDIFDPALDETERGFTAVVGNPPYFNLDTLGRGALEYDWLRFAYADIYNQTTDILYYFFGRAHHILREGGDLGFIVSRSFIQAAKAANLRQFLIKNTKIDYLGHKVFKAGIATAIIQWSKARANEGHQFNTYAVTDFERVKQSLNENVHPRAGVRQISVQQQSLEGENWTISPYAAIFEKLDADRKILEEVEGVELGKGMETGANEVFFLSWERIVKLRAEPYAKPRATSSLIKRFGIEEPRD